MPEPIRQSDILVTDSPRSPGLAWTRQIRTAEAIGAGFARGTDTILLADEVGMGKTYVALATMADYLLQSDANDRKVLLVTPPSSVLRVKWQQEIQSFNEHYLTESARGRKGMQAVVINSYWDLLRNLKDFQNHQVLRVHEDDRQCFIWCMFNWAFERRLLGKVRRVPWPAIADLHLQSPSIVNFLSHYSEHAIWRFLDADYRLQAHHYQDLFRSLQSGRFDNRPLHAGGQLYGRADIAKLLKRFARQQDACEPNIYIIGMNALTRPRIDQQDNKFLSKYLLCHLLFRRRAETWRAHAEALIQANILAEEFADKHSHRWRRYMESMDSLACSPFYGLQQAVDDTVRAPDIQEMWRPLSDAIMRGDTSGARDFFHLLHNRVFQAQLARANVGLAVVDEVHNWKGGAFGAPAFRDCYAPGIANKLIMSATPFQMEEGEMARLFSFVQAPGGGSEAVMQALYAEDGEVARCLAANDAFARAWHALSASPMEAQRLPALFESADIESLDRLVATIAADPGESDEIRNFCVALASYRTALSALQVAMAKVVIRHAKSRDKRHFHIGEDFPAPTPGKVRNSLYPAAGHASQADALVNFIGMRLGQLALRGGDKSFEGNARLLGGMTSSTSAFLESARDLATTPAAQAYGAMFRQILDQRLHPKVAATVERAFHNFEAGRKTLIFCERVATLKEIAKALTSNIEGFIEESGTDSAIERENLLKRREVLENLWWYSLWEGLGQPEAGNGLLERYLPEAQAFVVQCLAKASIYPSARRIINLLDTWLIGRAIAEGQLPRTDWMPALEFFAHMAALLGAELLQEDSPVLHDFLAPRRGVQENDDTAAEDAGDDHKALADRTAITTAVETVIRHQYRERHNLWLMGEDGGFHPLLWQLLASEAAQLGGMQASDAPADLATQTAWVFYDVLNDLMDGIRKFTLRDDLLVRYKRASRAGTVLGRVAEGMRTMQIGHDSSMLARVNRFLTGLVEADGSISRANLAQSRRKSLWQGVSIGKVGYVATLNGSTPAASRAGLCAAFNSPLLPDILICTAIGSEGIDLHRQCADVIHHDLPWNPAKLEQRNGRVDRVGSLAQMSDGLLIHLGIPFLAHNYEQYQYQKVFSRAQKFEVLLGSPEFDASGIDEESYRDDSEETVVEVQPEAAGQDTILLALPPLILEALRLDLAVRKSAAATDR